MEGSGSQHNYLINEDQTIGKVGKNDHEPNTLISILHFKNHSIGEKWAVLHCDICPGICNIISYLCWSLFFSFTCTLYAIFASFLLEIQVKKNTGYLLWRVMIGLHRAIDLHMQIPGHTKCHSGFVQIKKRSTGVDSIHYCLMKYYRSKELIYSVF